MDNPTFPQPGPAPPGPGRRTVVRFVPDRRYTALAAAGTVLAVLVAAFAGSDPGRLLAAIAAVILAASATSDVLFSPRLTASPDGLAIRSPFTRAALAWPQVESVRVVSRGRLGLRSRALEVDAGEVLAEFTRRTLGTDLDEACALVTALRPPG